MSRVRAASQHYNLHSRLRSNLRQEHDSLRLDERNQGQVIVHLQPVCQRLLQESRAVVSDGGQHGRVCENHQGPTPGNGLSRATCWSPVRDLFLRKEPHTVLFGELLEAAWEAICFS